MDLLISRPFSEWLSSAGLTRPFPPILLPRRQPATSSHYIIPNQFIIIVINMVKLHTSLLAITLVMGSALATRHRHHHANVNHASASNQHASASGQG